MKIFADLKGKEEVFLTNAQRFVNGLKTLDLFKYRPERLSSGEVMQSVLDGYRNWFERGKTGNRIDIGQRNKARKDFTERFNRILRFLESIAEEEDIPALLAAGFKVVVTKRRAASKKVQQQAVLVPTGA
jgi:hypothetical protein